jgi:hypothetical protein
MEMVVALRGTEVHISYESAAALDEPPYLDESFWEPYDHGFDAPLMRYDWSDTWVSPDMGASLSLDEWDAINEALNAHRDKK